MLWSEDVHSCTERLVQGTLDTPQFSLLRYAGLLWMGFKILADFFVFFPIFVD